VSDVSRLPCHARGYLPSFTASPPVACTSLSILLLKPQMSSGMCPWRKWAPYLRLAGRGRHTLRCQPACCQPQAQCRLA